MGRIADDRADKGAGWGQIETSAWDGSADVHQSCGAAVAMIPVVDHLDGLFGMDIREW